MYRIYPVVLGIHYICIKGYLYHFYISILGSSDQVAVFNNSEQIISINTHERFILKMQAAFNMNTTTFWEYLLLKN